MNDVTNTSTDSRFYGQVKEQLVNRSRLPITNPSGVPVATWSATKVDDFLQRVFALGGFQHGRDGESTVTSFIDGVSCVARLRDRNVMSSFSPNS
jgi:hypothetical protein